MRTGWDSSGCPTTNLKNTPKQKILPPRRSLPLINTSQLLENLFYCSITLKIFKNDTLKDEFERKTTVVAAALPYDRRGGDETFLLKKGYLGNFVKGKGGI